MTRRWSAPRIAVVLFLLGALLCARRAQAQRYLPGLRFRVLTTAHFAIYFHQGEEQLAQRLSGIVEDSYRVLTARLNTIPSGRTHVILADQNDSANGWATPLPYNTIEISAIWPAAGDDIGNTGDWLRLVFTHEYTHILLFDQSRGFASALRFVLGRSPLAFPNVTLPEWQIEGLAVYQESAVTGRGRVPAGSFRAIVDEPARRARAEPLDRASGGLDDWPAGNAEYAYGAYFYKYLADRFGDERIADLQARTAGRLYYLQSPAFKRVFGRSLGQLWSDFEQGRASELAAAARTDTPASRRITFHGFTVAGPRYVPLSAGTDATLAAVPRVVYSLRNADDFPALMEISSDGAHDGRLASRYYGDALGVAKGLAWFSQFEVRANVATESDLYALDMATRHVTRVTHDGRFMDPDVSPDGQHVACIVEKAGRRSLAVLDVTGGHSLSVTARRVVGGPDDQYSSPRWSPDGRSIAAARVRRDGTSDIVRVDAASGDVVSLVSSLGARNVAPAWTPDGRSVIFASDPDGAAFNLFAVDIGEDSGDRQHGRLFRLTRIASGATEPDVSPDGRTIVYVGYTMQGHDLFTIALDRQQWEAVGPAEAAPSMPAGAAAGPAGSEDYPASAGATSPAADESRRYSPLNTLLPRSWLPAVETSEGQLKVGATVGSTDALARHAYDATVLLRIVRDPDSGSTSLAGRPDWSFDYAYTRWRPAFFLSASESTKELETSATYEWSDPVRSVRQRDWQVGIRLPFVTVRHAQVLQAALSDQSWGCTTEGKIDSTWSRNALRLSWAFNSAKEYGYSISQEQGVAAGVATEHVRRALGADGNADSATFDLRSYVRLGGRHAILAARAGFGIASGDMSVRRQFFLGGAGPTTPLVDFGSETLSMLRGFGSNVAAGSHVVNLGLEYRVPIARIERGYGTWPLFARKVWAAAFVDGGTTWDGHFAAAHLKRSYGAEVSLDVMLGYALPMTWTAGIAFPQHPSITRERTATVYFRIGRSF
jgi:dipeptidyl aminopeptidase/acylaminoacyl peptidase